MRPRLSDSLVEDIRTEAGKEMTVDPEDVHIRHSIRALVDYHERKHEQEMKEALKS